MVPELEKPRITEIHVRMDCNGCVQKIKRALHGINGIYDLYIDFPNQKLTIVGWADPEKIVKAIKKTRKTATICSHTEPPDPAAQPPEQPPDGGAPRSDAANPPPQETPPSELPKDVPPPENAPLAPENDPNSSQPEPEKKDGQPSPDGQQPHPPVGQPPAGPKDVGEVHVVYHHPPPPPDYSYRYGYARNLGGDRWYSSYPRGYDCQQELPPAPQQPPPMPLQSSTPLQMQPPTPVQSFTPLQMQPPPPQPHHQPQPQPVYVTHSYNTYKPSPYVTEYHDYAQPQPPQPQYRYYAPARHDQYAEQDYVYNHPHYYQGGTSSGSGNGNITSFFSDENPNACRVM